MRGAVWSVSRVVDGGPSAKIAGAAGAAARRRSDCCRKTADEQNEKVSRLESKDLEMCVFRLAGKRWQLLRVERRHASKREWFAC